MLPNLSSSSLSQFVFLLYIFSKNDLYTVSLDQYSQIINEIILFIENNEEIFFEMTVDQLINFVQSVSKGCFMTQKMKIVFGKIAMQFGRYRGERRVELLFVKIVDSFFNLAVVDKEFFQKYLQQYLGLISKSENSEVYYQQLGKTLVKMQYFENVFWNEYFKRIPKMLKNEKVQKFYIYYTISGLELFKNMHNDDQIMNLIK